LVGSSTLKLAVASPEISEVVAPTRTLLAFQKKLVNLVDARLEGLT
jgi:hypothetical protein